MSFHPVCIACYYLQARVILCRDFSLYAILLKTNSVVAWGVELAPHARSLRNKMVLRTRTYGSARRRVGGALHREEKKLYTASSGGRELSVAVSDPCCDGACDLSPKHAEEHP